MKPNVPETTLDPTWISAFVLLCLAVLVAFGQVLLAIILRVKARHDLPTKAKTYECGEEPDGIAWVRFHPRYYVIALLFVLFDVETVFILPWALNVKPMGGIAIMEMVVFVGILLLGWAYAWRKGALEWQ